MSEQYLASRLNQLVLNCGDNVELLASEVRKLSEENNQPTPPAPELDRYGIQWNGPTEPLPVPMSDGYWTPWHIANDELQRLKEELDNVSHLARFLAVTWDKLNTFVRTNYAGKDRLSAPVVQGQRNQMYLRELGSQPFDGKKATEAVKRLIR